MKKYLAIIAISATTLVTGCASVPMAPVEADTALKQFSSPSAGKAGLYIYRNSMAGQSLKKTVFFDGKLVGETANKVYFYKQITPGKHTLSTESEFSDNSTVLNAVAGKNHFFEQEIKLGMFVGGAKLTPVDEKTGMQNIKQCRLGQQAE